MDVWGGRVDLFFSMQSLSISQVYLHRLDAMCMRQVVAGLPVKKPQVFAFFFSLAVPSQREEDRRARSAENDLLLSFSSPVFLVIRHTCLRTYVRLSVFLPVGLRPSSRS